MRHIIKILSITTLLMLSVIVMPVYAAECETIASGDWSDPSIWTDCNGGIPGANDLPSIESGHIVTNSGSITVLSLGVYGTFTNSGSITAEHFANFGTLINSGSIVADIFPNFPPDGSVTNSGSIIVNTLLNESIFTNICGGTLSYDTLIMGSSTPLDYSVLITDLTPCDNRINWQFGDLYAASYAQFDKVGNPALHIYCVDQNSSEGVLGMIITEDNLSPYPEFPAENTLIEQSNVCNASFYILTTGEYQLNIGPDQDGKIRVMIANDLHFTNWYGYIIEPS